MNNLCVTLSARRDVIFDEICEDNKSIIDMLDLVPDYMQHEAREIAQEMIDRRKSWISVDVDDK